MNRMKYIFALVLAGSMVTAVVMADDTSTSGSVGNGGSAPFGGGFHRGWFGHGGQGPNQNGQNAPGQNPMMRGIGNSNNTGNICEMISNRLNQIQQRINNKQDKYQDRLSNWEQKTSQEDANLTNLRNEWAANRDAQFSALEAKATTSDQKQAVSDFEAAVKAAISARESAVDAAIATFRDGVKNLITSRGQSLDSCMSAYESALNSAFGTAQSSCGNSNPDYASIRTALNSSLQTARTTFQSCRQSAPKVGGTGDIEALIATRKSAIDKAMSDFHAAMETARTNLKKAFPNDTGTGSTEPNQ